MPIWKCSVCTRTSAFVQHGSNPLPHLWDSPPNHHLPRIAKNGEEKEKPMVNAPHVSRGKVCLSGGARTRCDVVSINIPPRKTPDPTTSCLLADDIVGSPAVHGLALPHGLGGKVGLQIRYFALNPKT